MVVYNTDKEIIKAIRGNRISGVVEVGFYLPIGEDLLDFNIMMTNELVGEKYGYLLEDINYLLVDCDTIDQTLSIRVNASAEALLHETKLNRMYKRN
jgi:hypothetical protein